jgi:hypothetical protein
MKNCYAGNGFALIRVWNASMYFPDKPDVPLCQVECTEPGIFSVKVIRNPTFISDVFLSNLRAFYDM